MSDMLTILDQYDMKLNNSDTEHEFLMTVQLNIENNHENRINHSEITLNVENFLSSDSSSFINSDLCTDDQIRKLRQVLAD